LFLKYSICIVDFKVNSGDTFAVEDLICRVICTQMVEEDFGNVHIIVKFKEILKKVQTAT
jgi:hypothetical protein